jgi:hypothetical protein
MLILFEVIIALVELAAAASLVALSLWLLHIVRSLR